MKTTQEIFSHNLVNMLVAKDKTQSDLARFLNTTPNTVSKWALGKAMPRTKMLDGICRFLVCTPEDLMTDHSKTVVMLPQDIIIVGFRLCTNCTQPVGYVYLLHI